MKNTISMLVCAVVIGMLMPKLTLANPAGKSRGYATVPFTLSNRTLPAHYLGHDAERLYSAIQNKLGISKGEYETSSHFVARLNNAYQGLLYGSMHLSDVYAFRVDNGDDRAPTTLNISYDADHETLCVSPVFTCDNSLIYYGFSSRDDEASKYSASNAYGVQKTVGKLRQTAYCVAIDNIDYFTTVDGLGTKKIVITIPMPPNVARITKPRINVLAVSVLARKSGSYTASTTSQSEPTIDSPIDYSGITHYVNISVKQFLVYDQISGSILAVVTPNQKPLDRADLSH